MTEFSTYLMMYFINIYIVRSRDAATSCVYLTPSCSLLLLLLLFHSFFLGKLAL